MAELLLGAVAVAASWLLTARVRSYALGRRLIDLPNERSSHQAPTPRGGGLAFVLTTLLGCTVLLLLDRMAPVLYWSIVVGGSLVALVGFIDDHGHVAARWRFMVHLIAAVLAVWWLDYTPVLPVGDQSWNLGWSGRVITVVGLVWLMNLYNFMDGIDALAALEAVLVSLAAVLLGALQGQPQVTAWLLLVAGGCVGFLYWNRAPARVFMGDVGSGFLGYVLGVAAIASADGPMNPWTWLILLGVFLVDATVTLLRRVLSGRRWWLPHRSHAYQFAARYWGSHTRVSVVVVLINLLWLVPLAMLSVLKPAWAALVTVLAWAPLLLLALALGAGGGESTALPNAPSPPGDGS